MNTFSNLFALKAHEFFSLRAVLPSLSVPLVPHRGVCTFLCVLVHSPAPRHNLPLSAMLLRAFSASSLLSMGATKGCLWLMAAAMLAAGPRHPNTQPSTSSLPSLNKQPTFQSMMEFGYLKQWHIGCTKQGAARFPPCTSYCRSRPRDARTQKIRSCTVC